MSTDYDWWRGMVLLCSGGGGIADGGLFQHILVEERQGLTGLVHSCAREGDSVFQIGQELLPVFVGQFIRIFQTMKQ